MLIADGLLEDIVGQANPDEDVTFHWGEPDDDGNWMPVIQMTPKKVALPLPVGQMVGAARPAPVVADGTVGMRRGE